MNGLILVRESYPVGFAAMSGVFGAILGAFSALWWIACRGWC